MNVWSVIYLVLKVIGAIGGLFVLSGLAYLFIGWPSIDPSTEYGVTWSSAYAEFLGIDSQKGLEATLDDLGVRRFRIPAYWPSVEPNADQFQWNWLDRELDAIATRHGQAIVVVGAKQPRWPECWVPTWTQGMSEENQQQKQLAYVTRVVQRYAHHPAIVAWQVENEPALAFGDCSNENRDFIIREMQAVKQIDPTRPVYTTESGELSSWISYGQVTDGIGISVYRVILAPVIGQMRYPFPSLFYRRKANLVSPWVKNIYVSEFQMEPWVKHGVLDESLDVQFKSFDVNRMKDNFVFAERLHMSSVYFWGVEWWYWMKTQKNYPEFWEMAKEFFNEHKK